MPPEAPRRKPKMAQGKKAGERPPDTLRDKLNELLRNNKNLQMKKLKEIIDRQNQED